ncbi:MAG: AbrB/MazE/SpoVT family DNA-binding domain-containing protein [Candidatus Freyarchaeota archaeon]
MTSIAKVGKRGEVVLKKAEREAAGIKAGDTVVIFGRPGEVIIRKIPSLEDVLSAPPKVKISVGDLARLRGKVREELEERLAYEGSTGH